MNYPTQSDLSPYDRMMDAVFVKSAKYESKLLSNTTSLHIYIDLLGKIVLIVLNLSAYN